MREPLNFYNYFIASFYVHVIRIISVMPSGCKFVEYRFAVYCQLCIVYPVGNEFRILASIILSGIYPSKYQDNLPFYCGFDDNFYFAGIRLNHITNAVFLKPIRFHYTGSIIGYVKNLKIAICCFGY